MRPLPLPALVVAVGVVVVGAARLMPAMPGYYVTAATLVFGAALIITHKWSDLGKYRWPAAIGGSGLIALVLWLHYPHP